MPLRVARAVLFGLLVVAVIPAALYGRQQPAPKALTNADIVEMVASKLPESTIIRSMQANPTNFDVSPSALIELNKAGVSSRIMDAMIAAVTRNNTAAARGRGTARGTRGGAIPMPSSNQPAVALVAGTERKPIVAERTQMTQSSTKARSLADISKDKVVNQAVRSGVGSATQAIGSSAVGSAVGQTAGGLIGGVIANSSRNEDVLFVWALPGVTSDTVLESPSPVFEVSMGRTLGVNAADYAPVIVKLTPLSTGRLVGATEGKDTAGSRSVMDWPIYSSFIEDRVPVDATKTAEGGWRVTVPTPLVPGEYALVLRPVSKDKRFSGADVARNQGDGVLFNAVWSFVVR